MCPWVSMASEIVARYGKFRFGPFLLSLGLVHQNGTAEDLLQHISMQAECVSLDCDAGHLRFKNVSIK